MAGTATQVYDTFAAFTPAMTSPGGVNYIVPGNTDPTKSSFVCSVDSTTGATCGNLMPKGLAPLSATDVQMIRTWVTCGAPDN
jgi:hypothetical protein